MHTYPPARPLYRPVTGNQSSTRGNTRPAYLFPQGQQIMVPYSAVSCYLYCRFIGLHEIKYILFDLYSL